MVRQAPFMGGRVLAAPVVQLFQAAWLHRARAALGPPGLGAISVWLLWATGRLGRDYFMVVQDFMMSLPRLEDSDLVAAYPGRLRHLQCMCKGYLPKTPLHGGAIRGIRNNSPGNVPGERCCRGAAGG